ncbi:MAG: GNAT family N-acetyltransferase [candidate division Zixibacteria bacterium]|nr:GNAT family N-acetyltransferase [candidate division Zixibacteria bacterium]
MIRTATIDDIQQLVDIEDDAFRFDRFSREQFQHLLTRGHALVLVEREEDGPTIGGDAVLLFRRGTSTARLYSIAVRSSHRGRGVARRLLTACESAAMERDCLTIRLEVAEDNVAARTLYESIGYREFDVVPDYYENGSAAIRYEKFIVPHPSPETVPVPFYAQTLDFTCGAASLLMALRRFDATIEPTRETELDLWREATLIFMTSGVGGCGPFGLAVAALKRGFQADVYMSHDAVPFIEGVRSPEKKEVMTITHHQLRQRARDMGGRVSIGEFGLTEVMSAMDRGFVPVVLVSGYRLIGEKAPHWVVVTGYDDRYLYLHDPYVDDGASTADSINLPIRRRDFNRIQRYGKGQQRAMVAIGPRE